ncbi:hypothetical protein V2J09_009680 [Rumex salicifolius]
MKVERSVILVALFVILGATLMEGEHMEDKNEFGYKIGTEKGPEKWGFLNPQWEVCNKGKMQSPIDLSGSRPESAPVAEKINYYYKPGNATLKNRGHDIEVHYIHTQTNLLRERVHRSMRRKCIWYIKMRRTKRQSLESFTNLANPTPFSRRSISHSSQHIEVGVLNPAEIIFGRGNTYYRYMGSFTTPPCTQGVIWTIHTKVGTVSQQQIDILQQAVEHHAAQNARPSQPINGRKINLYFNCPLKL